MTDSHADIGAPRYQPPQFTWAVRCLQCQATGVYYKRAEAEQWVAEHECPPPRQEKKP